MINGWCGRSNLQFAFRRPQKQDVGRKQLDEGKDEDEAMQSRCKRFPLTPEQRAFPAGGGEGPGERRAAQPSAYGSREKR